MINEIRIRVEFNTAKEKITFSTPLFRANYLGIYDPDKHIGDFAIIPIEGVKFFTEEAINILLTEFDEKMKGYEILEVINIV